MLQGKMTWPNGTYYDGLFDDSGHFQYGIFKYQSGRIFKGYFKDNEAYFGTLYDTNGYVFRGWMANGHNSTGNWYFPGGAFERVTNQDGRTIMATGPMPLPSFNEPVLSPPPVIGSPPPRPDLPPPSGAPSLPNPPEVPEPELPSFPDPISLPPPPPVPVPPPPPPIPVLG
jgi:hypothetical protein